MVFNLTPTRVRSLPEYRVRQSSRARHVTLTIHPVDGLVVIVPRGFDEQLLPNFIRKKRIWIETKLEQFSCKSAIHECGPRPVRIVLPATNENWTIAYHGNRSKTVRITTHDDGALRATGAVDDMTRLGEALRRWLKHRAEQLLPHRLTELARLHGFDFSRVTIRHQSTRWGSCSSNGTISLNAKLMFVSPELVNHILLHELSHTIHPHHGYDFQMLMACLEPNYQQQRAALREAWRSMPDWAHR